MKKTVVAFAITSILGLTGSLAIAQEQSPANPPQAEGSAPAQHAGRIIDPAVQAQHLAKRLKLTADQQSQVLSILTAQRDQTASVRSDSSLSREDRRSKMMSVRSDNESKIRALLSDVQKQAFDQMQQQRRQRQQNHRG